MAETPLHSPLYAGLFGDAETLALFTDEAEIAAMVEVERAIARVQGGLGLIPGKAAAAIDRELAALADRGDLPTPEELAQGTASAGVPVPALVAALRRRIGREAADHLHFAATSQDIVDTGLMLRLGKAVAVLEKRLAGLVDALATLARAHGTTPMAGRTRTQGATPVSFGFRVAGWALPLARALARTRRLSRDGLAVQLGGASGDLAALFESAGAKGLPDDFGARLAGELGLSDAPPWMTDRQPLVRVADLCSAICTAGEKLAADVLIAARSEIGELRLKGAGGSSTMPQKQNPVRAEAVVALARQGRGLAAMLSGTPAHQDERDGAGWMGEWLILPQLLPVTGALLLQAGALVDTLEPQVRRMGEIVTQGGGALLAERLSFALVPHVGRARSQDLVKAAAAKTRTQDITLVDALKEIADSETGEGGAGLRTLDWEELGSFAAASRPAAAMTERLLAEVDRLTRAG
ncbi:lyase family protein [Stappia sp. ICDLI1TA098]